MKNILFIGSSGAGKSSIINSFFDQDLAPTSNSDTSCTPDVIMYTYSNYNLYDTCGFFETTDQTINISQSLNDTFQYIVNKTRHIYFDKIILVIDVSLPKFYDDYKLFLNFLKTFLGKKFTDNVIICLNKINVINHRNKIIDFNIYEKIPSLYAYLNSEWNKVYPQDFVLVRMGMTNIEVFRDELLNFPSTPQLNLGEMYENTFIQDLKKETSVILYNSFEIQQQLNNKLKWANIRKVCATDTRAIISLYVLFIAILIITGLDNIFGLIPLIFVGIYHYKHFDTLQLDKDIISIKNLLEQHENKIYDYSTYKYNIKIVAKPKNKNTLIYIVYLQFSHNSDMIKIFSYDYEVGYVY